MDNSTRSVFAILFHEDNYIMMEENEVCRERLCSQAIQVMGRAPPRCYPCTKASLNQFLIEATLLMPLKETGGNSDGTTT